MKMSSLGNTLIKTTPLATNPEILMVDIGAENRKDAMTMQTNKDETVDQFCTRIRSMLRSLVNGEPRLVVEVKVKEADRLRDKTWAEQKAGMENKGQVPVTATVTVPTTTPAAPATPATAAATISK
jgi:hypothetical protein